MGAGAGLQNGEGFRPRQRGTVCPRRGEGVEAIRDGDEASQQRDLPAGQAVGIAAAVQALMMTADGRQHFAVANHGGQDALAHPRMAPDNAIFLRRQPGRLVQDGVGYADLADVVQHGGQAEMLALAAVQTEGGGEMQGEATHAPGVAGRVRIAFLDRAHQAGDSGQESAAHTPSLSPHGPLQRALRALVVLMAMIASPGGLQDVAQFVELDGLEEIVVRTGVETFAGGVRIVAGRQDDDADVGPARRIS